MQIPLDVLEALFTRELAVNVWPFFRIAGVVMVAPVFGARLVPMRTRLAFAVAATYVLSPLVPITPPFELSLRAGFIVAQEVLIGAAMGFCLQMIFDALITAGQTIAMSMQDLLVDRVPVRNIRTIAETLAENAARSQDPAVLLAHVREALGSSIVQGIYGLRDELPVITLDPTLEQMLREGLKSGADAGPSFEPGLADRLHGALADAAQQQELRSEPAVLLVPTVLRPWLARFTRHGLPNLAVLAYGEIPTTKSLRVVASVGSAAGANARAATRAA